MTYKQAVNDDRFDRLTELSAKFDKRFTDAEKGVWIRLLDKMDYKTLVMAFDDVNNIAEKWPRAVDFERAYKRLSGELAQKQRHGQTAGQDPSQLCAHCEDVGLIPMDQMVHGHLSSSMTRCGCSRGQSLSSNIPFYSDYYPGGGSQYSWDRDKFPSYMGAYQVGNIRANRKLREEAVASEDEPTKKVPALAIDDPALEGIKETSTPIGDVLAKAGMIQNDPEEDDSDDIISGWMS
jgi:hypothetical protein